MKRVFRWSPLEQRPNISRFVTGRDREQVYDIGISI